MKKLINNQKDWKICPSCLGTKKEYSPEDDEQIECTYCDGEGRVNEEDYDLYNPVYGEIIYNEELNNDM